MPAEWHPHDACWIAWPCSPAIWPRGDGLERAKRASAQVARAIARFEPVNIMASTDDLDDARAQCGPNVNVLEFQLDNSWTRDTGPTFVIDGVGALAAVDWRFNRYGNKGGQDPSEFAHDVALAGEISRRLGTDLITASMVLEGGSIHVDGDGTVLTTEQCLLNPNRNPKLRRAQVEEYLCSYLGVESVIWLGQGLVDDDTDGHVDMVACFVQPGKVVALTSSDPSDANYPRLKDNLQRLRAARDARGRRLEVIEIEQPAERRLDDHRLPLSYINFYIANGGVVMPSCNDPHRDEVARQTIVRLFPDREVVQLPAMDLFAGGGGIHCITQQQPVRVGPIV